MGLAAVHLACFPSSIAALFTPSVHRGVHGYTFTGAPLHETTTMTATGDTVNEWVSCICYLAGIVCSNYFSMKVIHITAVGEP